MLRVMSVVGTRPEAIKMAPIIKRLNTAPWCHSIVVATAQHRELLDQVFDLFAIRADADLDVMRDGQGLATLTGRLFERIDSAYEKFDPDLILAQGDTTTVMVAAVSAFYRRIAFGHVEAGLRTGDLLNPFPEEFNRIVAGRVASMHFAPTATARDALLLEGIRDENVFVTGNTVVDAVLDVSSRSLTMPVPVPSGRRVILMTAHRRENFGEPMMQVFRAVKRILNELPDVEVIYPVHPNPNVRTMAHTMLGGLPRIHLVDPMNYEALVACLKACTVVLTDSGGLQEEAPALGKPVLVLRSETERPEAITAGVAKLVGTQEDDVYRETVRLLREPSAYAEMARRVSPYGDGRAAERILEIICRRHAGSAQILQGGQPSCESSIRE